MIQDAISFTKGLNVSSLIDYIQNYFDENMAMYEIAELCNFKDNISVSCNNQLIYHIKDVANIEIICKRLSSIVIPIYGNMYKILPKIINTNDIDITLINMAIEH